MSSVPNDAQGPKKSNLGYIKMELPARHIRQDSTVFTEFSTVFDHPQWNPTVLPHSIVEFSTFRDVEHPKGLLQHRERTRFLIWRFLAYSAEKRCPPLTWTEPEACIGRISLLFYLHFVIIIKLVFDNTRNGRIYMVILVPRLPRTEASSSESRK